MSGQSWQGKDTDGAPIDGFVDTVRRTIELHAHLLRTVLAPVIASVGAYGETESVATRC